MIFQKLPLGESLILAAPMKPTKLVRNKEGTPIEIYERGGDSTMRAFLWADLTNNGGIWMPQVHVKVFETKESKEPVLFKGVYMSKREYEELGLKKTSSNEEKKPKYQQYVKEHKEKYQTQMNQLFNEADRELAALKKHTIPESGGSIEPSIVNLLKDFVLNPNDAHTKSLLTDMKDKGYLRPMARGERKGQLLTDMKAINRVVLNKKLMITPSGISALIAKDLSDKLLKWMRWGFSYNLISDIEWWARKVSEQFNFSAEEAKEFKEKSHRAVEYYSKSIYRMVFMFNEKLKDKSEPEKDSDLKEEPNEDQLKFNV